MNWKRLVRALSAISMLTALGCGGANLATNDGTEGQQAAVNNVNASSSPASFVGEPLPVKVAVMSQCPYAAKSLTALLPVIEQLGPHVDFELIHVGRENEGVLTSMHGPTEVVGDVLQLCAARYGAPGAWLQFVRCQMTEFREIPENWQGCARQAQIPPDALCRCVEGGEGAALLRASFAAAAEREARGSPTFFFGDQTYRGGRSAEAFTRELCRRIDNRAPLCANVPPQPQAEVILVTDSRCAHSECRREVVEPALLEALHGGVPRVVDARSPEGQAILSETGVRVVPTAFVLQDAQLDGDQQSQLRRWRRLGRYYVHDIGRFDPTLGTWSELPTVEVTVLNDRRCKSRECGATERFESFVRRSISKVQVTNVDYDSPEGRALWQRLKAHRAASASPPERELGLPLATYSKGVEQYPEFFNRLRRRLVEAEEGYYFQLGPWNPEAEVCDNGVDDDGDRRVDCHDSDCQSTLGCRPEKSKQLRLFIMAHCPYSLKVINAMGSVLQHFDRNRGAIDFRLDFVGQVGDDGQLSSMHGTDELEEDLRLICVQRHYPQSYQFMDYVLCRAQDVRSDQWQQCVRSPLDVDVIRQCAQGPEGQRLLRQSFQNAKALGFRGTPSWLLNNRLVMEGREPEAIVQEYCAENPEPECNRPVAVEQPSAAIAASPSPGQAPPLPDAGGLAGPPANNAPSLAGQQLVLPGCQAQNF